MNQFWGDLLLHVYGILIKLARLLIICAAIIRVGWGEGGGVGGKGGDCHNMSTQYIRLC